MKVADRMSRSPTSVRDDEDLALALQVMLWRGIRHLPVMREGRLVGVLTERNILTQRAETGSLSGTVRDAMTTAIEVTSPDEPIENAAARMAVNRIGCLPVVSAGELVGILTTTDILGGVAVCDIGPLPTQAASPRLDVRSIMTPDPVRVTADDRLADAAARMVQRGVRHLPVVDGDDRVIGMLSDRDLRASLGDSRRWLDADEAERREQTLRVAHAMTQNPTTVTLAASPDDLVAIFLDDRVGAVPVVDAEEHLIGIVSYIDVLAATIEAVEG